MYDHLQVADCKTFSAERGHPWRRTTGRDAFLCGSHLYDPVPYHRTDVEAARTYRVKTLLNTVSSRCRTSLVKKVKKIYRTLEAIELSLTDFKILDHVRVSEDNPVISEVSRKYCDCVPLDRFQDAT